LFRCERFGFDLRKVGLGKFDAEPFQSLISSRSSAAAPPIES
jgi:hypothetical protein